MVQIRAVFEFGAAASVITYLNLGFSESFSGNSLKSNLNFSINVSVKRLGGGFGAKVVLAMHIATASAVAANKIKKPVRLWMNLEDNMRMMGKRNPFLIDYKVYLFHAIL